MVRFNLPVGIRAVARIRDTNNRQLFVSGNAVIFSTETSLEIVFGTYRHISADTLALFVRIREKIVEALEFLLEDDLRFRWDVLTRVNKACVSSVEFYRLSSCGKKGSQQKKNCR